MVTASSKGCQGAQCRRKPIVVLSHRAYRICTFLDRRLTRYRGPNEKVSRRCVNSVLCSSVCAYRGYRPNSSQQFLLNRVSIPNYISAPPTGKALLERKRIVGRYTARAGHKHTTLSWNTVPCGPWSNRVVSNRQLWKAATWPLGLRT